MDLKTTFARNNRPQLIPSIRKSKQNFHHALIVYQAYLSPFVEKSETSILTSECHPRLFVAEVPSLDDSESDPL